MDSHAFSTLRSLRYLDLSYNHLASIHPDAFSARNNSIQELNLSQALCNSSAILPVAAALIRGGFQNLSRLELASNEIVYLPLGMLSTLVQLEHLDLRNNSLVDIKNATLAGLELNYLDLTSNAFKTLRNEALSGFGRQRHLRLFLKDNPFVCNCDIEDLVVWLNQSQQVADAGKLVCVFPQDLQNTSLLELAGSELECHSGGHGGNILQPSYVVLGLILGVIGGIFLLVLYLNHQAIKVWMKGARGPCRHVMSDYCYRYSRDSGPCVTQVPVLDI